MMINADTIELSLCTQCCNKFCAGLLSLMLIANEEDELYHFLQTRKLKHRQGKIYKYLIKYKLNLDLSDSKFQPQNTIKSPIPHIF